MYRIVTGVTSDVGVSSTYLVAYGIFFFSFQWFPVYTVVSPFPWDDASQDELVAFYRHHVYTVSDILCVLLFRHHMVTSRRSVNRIIKRLGIRMRQNQHPLGIILHAIQHLHACRYSDVGYRTIWRNLNVTLVLRFSQHTVQTILQVVDTGVRRRTVHRLRRRVYHGVGPNGVIRIDGCDKLKPFAFVIPGAICGYTGVRQIRTLKGLLFVLSIIYRKCKVYSHSYGLMLELKMWRYMQFKSPWD